MAKPLFIAIGVHNAANTPQLAGVLTSVGQLAGWALSHGYEVVRVDDQSSRVTVGRIQDELIPFKAASGERDQRLLLDRPRIVVYFCGHGIHAPQDQYWILSAGPEDPEERISAVGFRDMLATYGPKQVAVISDACRSPMVVQGLGRSVVSPYKGSAGLIQKDNFFSSQDGEASFAVPSKQGQPAYCVFSSVLVRALSEPPDPDALDILYMQAGRRVVSSQSLATYLEVKVPDAALGVNRLQVPQCDPGFRPVINDYVEFSPSTSPANLAARQAEVERERTEAQNARVDRSRSEWRGPYLYRLQPLLGPILQKPGEPNPLLLSSYSDVPHVEMEDVVGSEAIEPDQALQRYLESSRPLRRTRLTWIRRPFADSGRSGTIVARAGDLFAAIPLHRRLWCAAIIEKVQDSSGSVGGVELLAWGSVDGSSHSRLSSAEALKGLSARTLNAEDTAILAEDIRNAKHADPMYGIVAAYLYNSIGDISNIRRMCCYYKSHKQDVPFDIAMLAQIELKPRGDGGFFVKVPEVAEQLFAERRPNAPTFVWEATPATTVNVAGVIPLLRAGWQHIQASPHAVHRQCWELTAHLTESPISTFAGEEVGKRLTQILRAP